MAYTPPSGSSVGLPFGASYTKPNAGDLVLDASPLGNIQQVGGWSSASYGAASVVLKSRPLRAQGFDASGIGRLGIAIDALKIFPSGIPSSLAFGATTASWRQFVAPASIDAFYNFTSVQRVRIAGGYVPPPASTLILEWGSDPYSVPPGSSVVLEFGALGYGKVLSASLGDAALFGATNVGTPTGIQPSGFVATLAGTAVVSSGVQTIGLSGQGLPAPSIPAPTVVNKGRGLTPSGFNAIGFGTHVIADRYRYLYLTGFNALGFGTQAIINKNKFVSVPGFFGASYGTPTIELLLRKLAPGGFTASLFGTAYLSGGIRAIDLGGRSLIATLYGSAFVAYAERLISPAGFFTTTHGKPQVGFPRDVEAVGSDLAQFGTADVHDNTQWLYTSGFTNGGVGEPFVAPHTRTLEQLTSPYDGGFGVHWARNTSRFVAPYTDTPETWGPYFSTFTYVENRDRAIATFGARASAFGQALIENGARAAALQGFDTSRIGQADLSHRIRTLRPESLDSFASGNWTAVVNGARPLFPGSFDASAYSRFAELRNTTRELTYAGGLDQARIGLAYADYRVRGLTQLQSIDYPYVPFPLVMHKQRFLEAQGLEGGRMGVPFIEEKFTKIAPRWVYVDMLGTAELRNRNREAAIYGYDLVEWGRPTLILKKAFLLPSSFGGEAIGGHRIGDTRQESKPVGFSAFRVGTGHKVQLLQPDLPVPQTIEASSSGEADPAKYGSVTVFSATLYPLSINDGRYGIPKVVSNGIMPTGFYLDFDEQWGIPSLNPPQFITNAGNIDQFVSPRQRLDPHTIWCTFDTPPQAWANHDGVRWEAVDAWMSAGGQTKPIFGITVVTLARREIQTFGSAFLAMTSQKIDLWTKYVRPNGLLAFRYGLPKIPTGEPVAQYGYDMAAYGRPTVAHYVDPHIPRSLPVGNIVFTLYGRPTVELFNRELKAFGIQPPTPPQVPYVGPQRRLLPVGIVGDSYGLPWASYRVRRVTTSGANTANLDYTVGRFRDRMRVYRFAPPQTIWPMGAETARIGYGNVSNRARSISPLNCCHQDRMGRPVVQAA
ncbi:TPA: hypothetical protein SL272_000825 [Pseudomonas aeruginosa]|nr:hypothetical protein [Pseudomonas aeruginosa]